MDIIDDDDDDLMPQVLQVWLYPIIYWVTRKGSKFYHIVL